MTIVTVGIDLAKNVFAITTAWMRQANQPSCAGVAPQQPAGTHRHLAPVPDRRWSMSSATTGPREFELGHPCG